MQNNLHTPQRLEGESFSDYKIRRKASKEVTKKNSQIGQGGYRTRKARCNIWVQGKMKYRTFFRARYSESDYCKSKGKVEGR